MGRHLIQESCQSPTEEEEKKKDADKECTTQIAIVNPTCVFEMSKIMFSDVTIKCKDEKFRVHKIILSRKLAYK